MDEFEAAIQQERERIAAAMERVAEDVEAFPETRGIWRDRKRWHCEWLQTWADRIRGGNYED